MTAWFWGKQLILFPKNLNFSWGGAEGPVLSELLFSWKFEAGNSINLAVTVVVSQHLQGTVHCYPLTS